MHYDETKKMPHDSQIFRAKENFRLSLGPKCLDFKPTLMTIYVTIAMVYI